MILLLSNDSLDSTTDNIMKWIQYLGGECVRINSQDVVERNDLLLNISSTSYSGFPMIKNISYSEVNIVWFWRWYAHDYSLLKAKAIAPKIVNHIKQEIHVLDNLFLSELSHCEWLGYKYINKLDVLQKAVKNGIKIPNTLVTNNKRELLSFIQKYRKCICKSLSDPFFFDYKGDRFGLYTAILNLEDILSIPNERIFPSIFQEYIEKDYEVRCFYIDGSFYSAAIFSQENEKTKVDFRAYDLKYPNRIVPCDIPLELKRKIKKMMLELNLKTGSIDLIKSSNDFIFLEINPVGQFEMISKCCNFRLEKIIAQYLISHDVKKGKKTEMFS